jgi:cytochrome b pre-mRNA-processing protein 3
MRFPLFRREPRGTDTISTLYGMIVAQARLPCFYREYAVDDTVNGRFDLMVLHMALVLEHFAADPALRELGQGLFDHFWRDMDHNLREMGVGDLSVPKKMRELGEAFYGRAKAYRAALADAVESALAEALARNIYGGARPDAARRLAVYMRQLGRDLANQEAGRLAAGILSFPDPVKMPAVAG